MKIARLIPALLAAVSAQQGKVLFHAEKLNEGSWAWHGRCWLHLGDTTLKFSWNLWARFCGIRLSASPAERGLSFHVAFPPAAFWWTVEGLGSRRQWDWIFTSRALAWWNRWTGGHDSAQRYTDFVLFSLSVHYWALWWECLKVDWGWSRRMPWWVSGSAAAAGALGVHIYSKEVLERRAVLVPMPEGAYPATAELRLATRGRKWWPFKRRNQEYEITLQQGIPVSGKGENSWDCGEDAIYGQSGPAGSIEEGVGKIVATAMETRRQRGDPAVWPTAPKAQEEDPRGL